MSTMEVDDASQTQSSPPLKQTRAGSAESEVKVIADYFPNCQ